MGRAVGGFGNGIFEVEARGCRCLFRNVTLGRGLEDSLYRKGKRKEVSSEFHQLQSKWILIS